MPKRIIVLSVGLGLLIGRGPAFAQERVTIGVLEIVGKAGVPQEKADVLMDLLAEEIVNLGNVEVVDQSDIRSMLQVDKRNQLAECTDNFCISEVMGALGVRFIITGKVSRLGKTYLLNLKLLDVASALVLGRVGRRIKGGEDELIEAIPETARELFDRVAARIGLNMPDRVTAAARHAQSITESPSAVIVITRKEIEQSGATSFEELLRSYPAVHVLLFDPLFPNAVLRGDTRVLFTLDGREHNLDFFEVPFLTCLPVGVQDIERIEVVLGPNSALYGANAVAGVIDVHTRQPAAGFSAEAYLNAGQRNTTVMGGRLAGGTGSWALQGTFAKDQADSWMARGSTVKDFTRASGTFRWDIADGSLTVDAGVLSGAGKFYSLVGYLDWSKFLFVHTKIGLELGRLKTRAYWYGARGTFDAEIGLRQPETGLLLATVPTLSNTIDTFELQAQYDFELFENNLFMFGADARYTRNHFTNTVNPHVKETRLGVFVHDEHQFGESLLMTLGARLDWNSKTDMAVSPRAALVYRLAKEHHLRLSGGVAFRKPSILETSVNVKVDAEPGFEEVETLIEGGLSNPNLDNEILTSLEAGYRGSLLDKDLRLGMDVYFNMYRDRVDFINDVRFRPPYFVQIDLQNSHIGYENRGLDLNAVGVNFSLEADPLDGLAIFLRAELQHSWYVDSGDRFHLIPRLLGSAGGTYVFPWNMSLRVAVVHVGERTAELRDPVSLLAPILYIGVPARTYITAALIYGFVIGGSKIELGLNLFNPFGGRFREDAGVIMPDCSNYGAELLDSRVNFSARLLY